MTGVVVGIPGPREAVVGHLVPFFARDFAGLAADADGRVGEETDLNMVLHIIVPAADSCSGCLRRSCAEKSCALFARDCAE